MRAPSLGYGDYVRFSQLVLDRCGLHFPPSRRADLEIGLQRAFAASTCADLDAYYHLLQRPKQGAVEMDRLINILTINESHFFRNAGLNDALYRHVLPQIIARQQQTHTLRIWSAGCASGEEPYSIAIMLRELLPDIDQWSITILGTDINTETLDRARQAVYGNWAFRETRAKQYRARYFRPVRPVLPRKSAPSGSKDPDALPQRPKVSRYNLDPKVQRMVTFAHFNLVEGDYPSHQNNTSLMDLIMCRNVTIYFTEDITARIVDRFYDALVNGGWLVVGHAEHSLSTYRRFQTHNFPGAILYQRTLGQEDTSNDQLTVFAPSETPAALPRPGWLAPAPIEAQPAPPEKSLIPAERKQTAPSPQQDPLVLERARELLAVGRSKHARDRLLPVVEGKDPSTPDYAHACTLLGQACANLGHWQEAENWCRQALRSDKLALQAYYTLALVLQHQGQLTQAIDAMKKVIYLDRNNILGHFGLADLYRNNHQLPQAQKSLANALRLLKGRAPDELIPGSDGINVARLRQTIMRQQQRWGTETNRS